MKSLMYCVVATHYPRAIKCSATYFLTLLLCLSLCACGSLSRTGTSIGDMLFGKDDEYLEDVPSRLVVEKSWSVSAVGSFKNDYLPLTLLKDKNYIYVCGPGGKFEAIKLSDGSSTWRHSLNEKLVAGVGGGNGIFLVGNARGEVLAVSDKLEEVLWRRSLGSQVLAISKNYKNTVIVRTEDNQSFAFRASDGKLRWKRKDPPPALTLKGASQPVFYGDMTFLGLDDGRLLVLRIRDGKFHNEMKLGVGTGASDLDRIVDIDGTMVIDDGFFFVSAYQGRTASIDLERNKLVWVAPAPSHVGLGVDNQRVYVTTPDNHVIALDRDNGEQIWVNDLLLDTILTAPISTGPLVAVGSDRGDIYWLSSKSGQVMERTKVGSAAIASLVHLSKNSIVSFDKGGKVSAIRVIAYRSQS